MYDSTFSHGVVLKKLSKIAINRNIESQYLKIAIHIEAYKQYSFSSMSVLLVTDSLFLKNNLFPPSSPVLFFFLAYFLTSTFFSSSAPSLPLLRLCLLTNCLLVTTPVDLKGGQKKTERKKSFTASTVLFDRRRHTQRPRGDRDGEGEISPRRSDRRV